MPLHSAGEHDRPIRKAEAFTVSFGNADRKPAKKERKDPHSFLRKGEGVGALGPRHGSGGNPLQPQHSSNTPTGQRQSSSRSRHQLRSAIETFKKQGISNQDKFSSAMVVLPSKPPPPPSPTPANDRSTSPVAHQQPERAPLYNDTPSPDLIDHHRNGGDRVASPVYDIPSDVGQDLNPPIEYESDDNPDRDFTTTVPQAPRRTPDSTDGPGRDAHRPGSHRSASPVSARHADPRARGGVWEDHKGVRKPRNGRQ
eukprot:Sspe_Gene.60320::Locus_33232_Transcript_1_1_Confidence_1.000_Length_908::g.60320::m.60320